MYPAPFPRSRLQPGDVLCNHCTAICCRYFSIELATPESWEDYDNYRWYLAHGRVAMFVDETKWFLLVYGDCQYLLPDNRCGIYHNRPTVCRNYSTDSCEYDNDFVFDRFFETPEQIWEYAEALLPPRQPLPDAEPAELQLPVLAR